MSCHSKVKSLVSKPNGTLSPPVKILADKRHFYSLHNWRQPGSRFCNMFTVRCVAVSAKRSVLCCGCWLTVIHNVLCHSYAFLNVVHTNSVLFKAHLILGSSSSLPTRTCPKASLCGFVVVIHLLLDVKKLVM